MHSKDHLARNCPKNPYLKKFKFEKKDREKTRREKSLFKRKKVTTIS